MLSFVAQLQDMGIRQEIYHQLPLDSEANLLEQAMKALSRPVVDHPAQADQEIEGMGEPTSIGRPRIAIPPLMAPAGVAALVRPRLEPLHRFRGI